MKSLLTPSCSTDVCKYVCVCAFVCVNVSVYVCMRVEVCVCVCVRKYFGTLRTGRYQGWRTLIERPCRSRRSRGSALQMSVCMYACMCACMCMYVSSDSLAGVLGHIVVLVLHWCMYMYV